MKMEYNPLRVRPFSLRSFGLLESYRSLNCLPPLSSGLTVLPTMALPTIFLPTSRQVLWIRHDSRMSVGFSHLPASSRYRMCSFSPSYALLVVFFQLTTVLRASPFWEVLFYLVIRFDGSRKASSIRGLVVPSWMGLKKKGRDL